MAQERVKSVKDRIKKLNRVLKVQEQLRQQAELKLATVRREISELKATQEALIQTMNEHETLHGLFIDVTAKRIQALAGQTAQKEVTKAAQEKAAFEAAMQVKRTEKALSGLEDAKRRDDEKKDLISIIEAFAHTDGARFP